MYLHETELHSRIVHLASAAADGVAPAGRLDGVELAHYYVCTSPERMWAECMYLGASVARIYN